MLLVLFYSAPYSSFTFHVPHLQEMGQHHVHVHVLLLPPAAHEAQVFSAGDGARL